MKRRMIRQIALAIGILVGSAAFVRADDAPRMLWIKAKCALCHGEDGASRTRQGAETHAPDLRTPAMQKLTDDELKKIVENGHQHMPSFKHRMTQDEVTLLLRYIRGFAKR